VLESGSAAKVTSFASDDEKVQEGLFQQPIRPALILQAMRISLAREDFALGEGLPRKSRWLLSASQIKQ
jgi:hypothetical protein